MAGLTSRPDGLIAGEAERFGAALDRLRGDGNAPLLLAVSGGPDSMAMLTLAVAERSSDGLPPSTDRAEPVGARTRNTPLDKLRANGSGEAIARSLTVATVDHGLRANSADEALMVARHCARIGVAHATLTPPAPIAGASLQARAREARYAALAGHARAIGAAAILTAHHADDAAETFLMRAARGSGLAGLAGVREATVIAGFRVLRPLLDWRRAELRAIVRRAGLPFVEDPANADDRHDRTRFRRLLEANGWLDPPHLAQAAAQLAAADAELRSLADWAWATRAEVEGATVRLAVADLPRELRRRLARRAVAAVRDSAAIATPPWSDAANIEPLLDALEGGHRATQAGVVATPRGDTWRFAEAPPRRSPSRTR